jgi:hypothetical protein
MIIYLGRTKRLSTKERGSKKSGGKRTPNPRKTYTKTKVGETKKDGEVREAPAKVGDMKQNGEVREDSPETTAILKAIWHGYYCFYLSIGQTY